MLSSSWEMARLPDLTTSQQRHWRSTSGQTWSCSILFSLRSGKRSGCQQIGRRVTSLSYPKVDLSTFSNLQRYNAAVHSGRDLYQVLLNRMKDPQLRVKSWFPWKQDSHRPNRHTVYYPGAVPGVEFTSLHQLCGLWKCIWERANKFGIRKQRVEVNFYLKWSKR